MTTVCACLLSHVSRVRFFTTPWTVSHQLPLSMGFSRQEYWNGLPFPLPEDLSDPGIEPTSLASPALAGGFFTTNITWEAKNMTIQFSSVSQLCPILCNPMDCSTPGLPVHHLLPEFTQTHVH